MQNARKQRTCGLKPGTADKYTHWSEFGNTADPTSKAYELRTSDPVQQEHGDLNSQRRKHVFWLFGSNPASSIFSGQMTSTLLFPHRQSEKLDQLTWKGNLVFSLFSCLRALALFPSMFYGTLALKVSRWREKWRGQIQLGGTELNVEQVSLFRARSELFTCWHPLGMSNNEMESTAFSILIWSWSLLTSVLWVLGPVFHKAH